METMLNGLKYKYTFTQAFGAKVLSYVNTDGDKWVNDTETNLAAPLESFEAFLGICNEIDEMYN